MAFEDIQHPVSIFFFFEILSISIQHKDYLLNFHHSELFIPFGLFPYVSHKRRSTPCFSKTFLLEPRFSP